MAKGVVAAALLVAALLSGGAAARVLQQAQQQKTIELKASRARPSDYFPGGGCRAA